jgi:DNA-binding NtrC family response regulator
MPLPIQQKQARAQLFAPYDVIGDSPAMHDVFRRAMKASQFQDLPVLIEGARGTPKRRVAFAIFHLDRARVKMPFFALRCADLPRVLATGGRTAADGWRDLLRVARGGTLFLDEVGDLAPEFQRILRAVARPPSANVRVLAAAERPAEELVRAGRLDAELSAWLTLFRIPLPPLRGRPEDVAAQARHVLQTARAGCARAVTDFGPGVLERLQRLPWEENTRQLEALLRRALRAKRDGAILLLEDLPAWLRGVQPDGALPEPVPHPGDCIATEMSDEVNALDLAAEEYERRLLQRLLGSDVDGGLRPDTVV